MTTQKLDNMTATDVLAELELKCPTSSRAMEIIEFHPDNLDILKKILAYHGTLLSYLKLKYRDDEKLVIIAVKEYVLSIQHASENIRNNYSFMHELLQRSGCAYRYIGTALSLYYTLANIAVLTYPAAIRYMKPEFFTFELIFNTLTCEEDSFFDIHKRLDLFGEPCTDNIYLMLEASRMYRKRKFDDSVRLYTDDILKEYHPILDWVRNTDFPDSSWPFIRQALLLNPEPFLNSQNILQQVISGQNDWGVLAEYVLYEDVLKYETKHIGDCKLMGLNLVL